MSYTYDKRDRLTQTNYGSAITSLIYDLIGNKLSMTDPDMGGWSYIYDTLGNLASQTDARGCTTTLTYDYLNRLSNKSYGTGCPVTNAVNYYYDEGTNQIGHRTSMTDGSGSTTWTYDARGRMTSETKVIGTSDTFLTSWTYNKADLISTTTYPGDSYGTPGEVVTTTYDARASVNSVSGNTTYQASAAYDAAGRMLQRLLGTIPQNDTLKTQYHYNPWDTPNQGGRMDWLRSGTVGGSYNSKQDQTYTYYRNGNILTIADADALGGTQTQIFTYRCNGKSRG